jgi:hypothetical protein
MKQELIFRSSFNRSRFTINKEGEAVEDALRRRLVCTSEGFL